VECNSFAGVDALSAIVYCRGGNLPMHRDFKSGWVLSISIGCSATFTIQSLTATGSDGQPKVTEIRLDSGDVLLYNGQRQHGITSLLDASTIPSHWPSTALPEFQRACIQFRDSAPTTL
jgi:alkylated DNA repair dioxygenase AlkB